VIQAETSDIDFLRTNAAFNQLLLDEFRDANEARHVFSHDARAQTQKRSFPGSGVEDSAVYRLINYSPYAMKVCAEIAKIADMHCVDRIVPDDLPKLFVVMKNIPAIIDGGLCRRLSRKALARSDGISFANTSTERASRGQSLAQAHMTVLAAILVLGA
jgi:hypothetical protein